MDGSLRLARAARRELPERDVVLRRRRSLEVVRHVGEPLSEGLVDDEDLPFSRYLADRSLRRRVGDHNRRIRVLEVVGVILRLEKRVRLGRDRADLLCPVPEGDEVHGVAQDKKGSVLSAETELEQQVAAAVHACRERGVGRLSFGADQRDVLTPSLLDVAVYEPGREVQLVSQVGVRDHAATSRISSTSISVSVSNVSRPSSAEASAGAPQYASSMPIARKSVCPARIAAGMSTWRSSSSCIRAMSTGSGRSTRTSEVS